MSGRGRIVAITAVAAALAAAVTVIVAHGQGGPEGTGAVEAPRLPEGPPPLALDLGLRTDREARDLRQGLVLYDDGELAEAARLFARHDSLEARVAQAFARWPEGTLDRLEQLGGLYRSNTAVQLHLGLARIWSGRRNAEEALREVVSLDPDSAYAVTAENLLYPEFAPDLPIFVPSAPVPDAVGGLEPPAQFAALEQLWRRGDRIGGLYYGVGLQRLGRQQSAARAFAAVAKRFPSDPEAQVAAAVSRFSKSDPADAFSRLGPLSQAFPDAATVRFHLGLLLLWRGTVPEAKRQLRLARSAEPGSTIAKEAGRYLASLAKAGA